MKILINDYKGRRKVNTTLLKTNDKTVWVRLPDGNHIKRKIGRDTPKEWDGRDSKYNN